MYVPLLKMLVKPISTPKHTNAQQPENGKKNLNLVLSINNPFSGDIITRENISCFTSCASPISMTQRINMMVK